MIKQTIEISQQAAHLTVRSRQLVLQRGGDTVASVPCEDIGMLLVDHPGTTYTHAALASLAEHEAALIVCGRDHLPAAVLLPLADHSQIVWRIHEQVNVSKPLRKQLWKQIVQAKVRAQAAVLSNGSPAQAKLLELSRQVRSGDPTNIEAQAARIYWQAYLPDEVFRRNTEEKGLNSFLNYGYAVLRAAVARVLVAAGLFPVFGLKHCHRANAFCLADDLMEPLRPMVDFRARALFQQGYDQLTSEAKGRLLEVLTQRVRVGSETGPLMVKLHQMAGSLVRAFRGEQKRLEIPVFAVPEAEHDTNEL